MYSELLHKSQSTPVAVRVTPQGTVPSPNRENLPQVGFWNQRDWTSYKSKQHNDGALTGEQGTKAFDFIESEEGIPVSADKIKAICRDSRELFQSIRVLWEESRRSVPESWGKMTFGNKEFFRQKIKGLYPELSFCEGNWKCEHLTTQLYPGWYQNHVKDKVEVGPDPKRCSKQTARSSKTPTPVPSVNVSGRSHSPPVPNPVLDNAPDLSALSSTLGPDTIERDLPPQTPIPITSTTAPAINIDMSLDLGTSHEIDVLPEASPNSTPALSPAQPLSLSPPPHLDDTTQVVDSGLHATASPIPPPLIPVSDGLSHEENTPPSTTLPLNTPILTVVAPSTSAASPQPGTTCNGSVQVCCDF